MRRLIFSDEEYEELVQFAAGRGMNPKEAILAFVRFGNRAASYTQNSKPDDKPTDATKPETDFPQK